MKDWAVTTFNGDTSKAGTTLEDLKMRVAERVIGQYGYPECEEVRNILNETKVGAWRRPSLEKELRIIFAAA